MASPCHTLPAPNCGIAAASAGLSVRPVPRACMSMVRSGMEKSEFLKPSMCLSTASAARFMVTSELVRSARISSSMPWPNMEQRCSTRLISYASASPSRPLRMLWSSFESAHVIAWM